jgi:hypothetical protein
MLRGEKITDDFLIQCFSHKAARCEWCPVTIMSLPAERK